MNLKLAASLLVPGNTIEKLMLFKKGNHSSFAIKRGLTTPKKGLWSTRQIQIETNVKENIFLFCKIY